MSLECRAARKLLKGGIESMRMHVQAQFARPLLALTCSLALASASGCGNSDDDDATNIGGTSGTTGGAATGGTHAGAGSTSVGGAGGTKAEGSGGHTGGSAGSAGSTSGAGADGASPVQLGAAAGFVILAKTGISTVPESAITGDVGVSPAAASYVTGFELTLDATTAFSTSTQVTGKIFAADYEAPTPADMTAAVSDMELAFTDAAGRAPDVTELGAGNIGGLTLEPGVYGWGTGLAIPTNVTLSGDAKGVWVFQIAQDLTVSTATSVVLRGGALAKNVFWQVAGQVELGTTAHFEGVVLSKTSIILGTGASINGRLLAQTAVTLDASTVVEPE